MNKVEPHLTLNSRLGSDFGFYLKDSVGIKMEHFFSPYIFSHMQLSFTDSIYIEIESWCTCKAAAKLSQHVSVVPNTVTFPFTSQLL